jgi:hypothetical protein
MARARSTGVLVVGLVILSVACSIAIRRDLSSVPAGQVGFDDMCGLQEYFDALEIGTSRPPRVVSALDLEGTSAGKPVRGGKERFAFDNDFQLKHLRRILNENWRRLPDQVGAAKKIEIEVKWSEKAGSKRVITDQDAEMGIGSETFYRQRRVMWKLPLPGVAQAASTDGGTSEAKAAVAAPGKLDGGAADR